MNKFWTVHLYVLSPFLKCKTKKRSKIPLIVKHHLALMPFALSEALCATCASEDGANVGNYPSTLSSGCGIRFWGHLRVSSKVRCLYLEGILATFPRMFFFFFLIVSFAKALGRRHAALRGSPFQTDWLLYGSATTTGCVSNTNTTKIKSKKDIKSGKTL